MSTQQVETATVVGTITLTGNATVIVTSARMSNSPKTISVAVTDTDTASVVAGLIRSALAFDADVSSTFLVSGANDKVILTAHTATANDTTLNISINNGSCTGLTAALTSADTTAGSGISNSYATLAEYKTWIAVRGLAGVVGTDASDDSVLEIIIESASRYIDREVGNKFYQSTASETRYYTAPVCTEVWTDNLTTLVSVSVDYANTRTYTDLATTDYDLMPLNAVADGVPYTSIAINPVSGAYFPESPKGVKIVGTFGWPSVPMDIKEATLAIAQSVNSSRSGQTSSGKMTVTAAGIVIRPEDIPVLAKKIIDNYRTVAI